MLTRKFKLIFLPGGTSRKHEFNFTDRQFVVCIGAFALAFLLLSLSTGVVMYKVYSARKVSALNLKNSELDEQLALANARVEQLSHKVANIAENGSKLRAHAHLPLIDPEIQQMGIGGTLPYQESIRTGASVLLTRLEELDRQINLQENSLKQIGNQLTQQAEYLKSVPSVRPVDGCAISSLFGRRRDPFTGRWEPHMGLDFRGLTGTPVYATADGKVIHIRREPAYGKVIIINHGNGYKTLYAHLHSYYVKRGQRIKRGDPIGELGNTGRSTGPHLHYEVIKDKQHYDPLDYMFDGYSMARLP